jgi:hypothetical protein
MAQLLPEDRVVRPLVLTVWRALLGSELTASSFSADTSTISTGRCGKRSVNPNGTDPSVTDAHSLDYIGVTGPHLLRFVPAARRRWRRGIDWRVIDRGRGRRRGRDGGPGKNAKCSASEYARSNCSATITGMHRERNGRQRRCGDAQSQKVSDWSTQRCRHISSTAEAKTCASFVRRATIEAHSNFSG